MLVLRVGASYFHTTTATGVPIRRQRGQAIIMALGEASFERDALFLQVKRFHSARD
jgi:hypothetical protein